jgi:hypothetical protein
MSFRCTCWPPRSTGLELPECPPDCPRDGCLGEINLYTGPAGGVEDAGGGGAAPVTAADDPVASIGFRREAIHMPAERCDPFYIYERSVVL